MHILATVVAIPRTIQVIDHEPIRGWDMIVGGAVPGFVVTAAVAVLSN